MTNRALVRSSSSSPAMHSDSIVSLRWLASHLNMELRHLYWSCVFTGIVIRFHATVGLATCDADLSDTNTTIQNLVNSMTKMNDGIGTLQKQVISQAAEAERIAAVHGDHLKNTSMLKTDIKELNENIALQLALYDVLISPTMDSGALINYTTLKRANEEARRAYFVDDLWRWQLKIKSLGEVSELMVHSSLWMAAFVATLKREQFTCATEQTQSQSTLNEINRDILLLNSDAEKDAARLSTTQTDKNNMINNLKTRLGDQCIPDALFYNVIAISEGVTIDALTFVSERCATYTAGAMSDCQTEHAEEKLKLLEHAAVLENKTKVYDSMDCFVSKAVVDFAKCSLSLRTCKELYTKENYEIENPYPRMTTSTIQAIQLYNDILEIRLNRTTKLERKVKDIGEKLMNELAYTTDSYLAERSYELHHLAMAEYVNQASKWLCSHYKRQCSSGMLCGLKSLSRMIPNPADFEKVLNDLKSSFTSRFHINDIIPFSTILPLTVYNYLLLPDTSREKRTMEDEFGRAALENMFRTNVTELYKNRGDEGILTRNIAWHVSHEVHSWLSLTPQIRFLISKVDMLSSNMSQEDVGSLVECVCVRYGCVNVDT